MACSLRVAPCAALRAPCSVCVSLSACRSLSVAPSGAPGAKVEMGRGKGVDRAEEKEGKTEEKERRKAQKEYRNARATCPKRTGACAPDVRRGVRRGICVLAGV